MGIESTRVPAQGKFAMKTFCNPVNMAYRFVQPDRKAAEPCREGSDPAVVFFAGRYFLATSKTSGLHWSDDLQTWHFIPSKVLPAEGYGPDLWIQDGCLHYVNGFGAGEIFRAVDVFSDRWDVVGVIGFITDPKIFVDDDGRVFLYHGCAVMKPLRAVELDPKTFRPISPEIELNLPDPTRHGWERSGEDNHPQPDVLAQLGVEGHSDLADYRPETWNEGAWMTKHNGRYYLQNSSPGTELNVYSDAISVGSSPLGPFEFQHDNPLSLKPGGFITGAGHGCTFTDRCGNLFHVATMRISRHFIYERRIGMFLAGFHEDGVMFCRARFGDYPHYIPDHKLCRSEDTFCGWMLQSYRCAVSASSETPGHEASFAVDENIRTYWAANAADPCPVLTLNLGMVTEIRAVQINFADHHCCRYADAPPQGCARFIVEASGDDKQWHRLSDLSQNAEDKTHFYLEVNQSWSTRCLRLKIFAAANGGIPAVSGFRVFGQVSSEIPKPVAKITANRRKEDPMTADISWKMPAGAFGVNVCWGVSPDRLHHCWQVLDREQLELRSLDALTRYYVGIEAFGRGGIACIGELTCI